MNEIHFDFEAFLALATVTSGLIVLAYHVFLKKRMKPDGVVAHVVDFARSVFPLVLVVLLVRSFVFEPFRIPSSSMMPTLLTGDFIYVNKSAYGLKMPVFHGTLIETGHPQRGDVAVFRYPKDQSQDYIKRIIGLPGDRIHYDPIRKQLTINGTVIPQSVVGPYTGFHDDIDPRGLILKKENLLGVEHDILTHNNHYYPYNYLDLTVPEGYYFAMGDNRDHSADSRVWGLVPERNLVGKAKYIWMHWRLSDFWEGLKRIGTKIS